MLVMKWRNLNIAVRIKLSPDAKVLLFLVVLYTMIGLMHISARVDARFMEIMGLVGFALGLGIYNDHKSNKLDVEVAEKGLGQRVTEIKQAARGQAASPEDTRKTGDPLT